MFKTIVASVALSLSVAGAALADDATPLTTDEVTRFVATMEPVKTFGEELKASDKQSALNVETKPKAGEDFQPYSKAVALMSTDYPAEHAKLNALVSPQGFTPNSWAAVGDRVIVAYLAEKLETENPGALQQMQMMDASMMAQMPKHIQDQMQSMLVMADAIKKASLEDREAVRPLMADIEKSMDSDE